MKHALGAIDMVPIKEEEVVTILYFSICEGIGKPWNDTMKENLK